MRDFLEALQGLDLGDRLDERREAAMDCKNVVLNIGGNGEIVKNIGEIFPYHSISVFCLALHVETVVLGDGAGLVVASDH